MDGKIEDFDAAPPGRFGKHGRNGLREGFNPARAGVGEKNGTLPLVPSQRPSSHQRGNFPSLCKEKSIPSKIYVV